MKHCILFIFIIFLLNISYYSFSQSNNCNNLTSTSIVTIPINKVVFKTIEIKKKKTKQKYSFFHVSWDEVYPLLINQHPYDIYRYGFLITDTSIIYNLLDIFSVPDTIRNEIIYNYSENRDTIFNDIIDYNNKVIVDESAYCYLLKDTTFKYAMLSTLDNELINKFLKVWFERNLNSTEWVVYPEIISSIGIYIPLKQ